MPNAALSDRLTRGQYVARRAVLTEELAAAEERKRRVVVATANGKASRQEQREAGSEVTLLSEEISGLDAAWEESQRAAGQAELAAKHERWENSNGAAEQIGRDGADLAERVEGLIEELRAVGCAHTALRERGRTELEAHPMARGTTPHFNREFNLSGGRGSAARDAAVEALRDYGTYLSALGNDLRLALSEREPERAVGLD